MATLIAGGLVWSGNADEPARAGSVAIEGGCAVERESLCGAVGRSETRGGTVIPGLIETRAHLCLNAPPASRAVYGGDGGAIERARVVIAAGRFATRRS